MLADRLDLLGHRCLRINLCFGDQIFWRRHGAVSYRGSLNGWHTFLEEFCSREGVTDIVLLGEQRDHHKMAVDFARNQGMRVTVTEWGYLRPDWITFEKFGMSGNSQFSKNPDTIRAMAIGLPDADGELRFPDSFAEMAFNGFCADVGSWALACLYPGYRSHLLLNPVLLYVCTGLRRWRASMDAQTVTRRVEALVANATVKPFFIFPMQIEADFQVRAYSPYPDLVSALEEILRSFASFATATHVLIVKLHPMDPGVRPWKRIISGLAEKFGVASRVEFLDGGDFDTLAAASSGVVTINSTCGVGAIKRRVPVLTLGQAMFHIPGLTFQGKLDAFWSSAEPPDEELCDAFLKCIASTIQIKGGFFSRDGLYAIVSEAALRLDRELVNKPLFERTE